MGQRVSLRDCIAPGKPAVLQLGYFGCPMLCDTVSQQMLKSMRQLDLSIGTDYSVIYVSFDPKETRTQAYFKKQSFVKEYDRPGAARGVHLLVGGEESIRAITDATGFKYKWVESSRQFSHAAVLMIVSPDGTLARYLDGVEYAPATLRMSLIEASEGKIGSPLDRLLSLCFQYDAKSGKYVVAAMGLMRLGGIVTVIVLATWIFRQLRKEKRARLAAA
jgi:protein SCO1/2